MAVALEGMQVVTGKATLPNPEDEMKEALIARGPGMLMPPLMNARC